MMLISVNRLFFFRTTISLLISSYGKEIMKKSIFIFPFILLISFTIMAQKQDPVPARPLAEKGAQGDIILGKEYKKSQLLNAPQILQIGDSSQKKSIQKRQRTKTKKLNIIEKMAS